jgi:hypothetical protein
MVGLKFSNNLNAISYLSCSHRKREMHTYRHNAISCLLFFLITPHAPKNDTINVTIPKAVIRAGRDALLSFSINMIPQPVVKIPHN